MMGLLLFLLAFLSPAWAGASCTVTPYGSAAPKQYRVRIEETGSRDTTEVTCTGFPVNFLGTVTSYHATLTAGTGTAIHPLLGSAAAFATGTLAYIGAATATSSEINEQGRTAMFLPAGKLYVRSSPNDSTADHAISTEILVVEGTP